MLRRTSKRVKEVVDKMHLPTIVRLRRSFWCDTRNGTEKAKIQFVLRQLAASTARCRITTLELPGCEMKGQDAERLAGVLAQCPALAHLDLSYNSDSEQPGQRGFQERSGSAGSWCTSISVAIGSKQVGQRGLQECWGSAQRWLTSICATIRSDQPGQRALQECCRSAQRWCTGRDLIDLNLSFNQIGLAGAEGLAGVLAQCPALAHLNFCGNWIGTVGEGRLRASWSGQASDLVL